MGVRWLSATDRRHCCASLIIMFIQSFYTLLHGVKSEMLTCQSKLNHLDMQCIQCEVKRECIAFAFPCVLMKRGSYCVWFRWWQMDCCKIQTHFRMHQLKCNSDVFLQEPEGTRNGL